MFPPVHSVQHSSVGPRGKTYPACSTNLPDRDTYSLPCLTGGLSSKLSLPRPGLFLPHICKLNSLVQLWDAMDAIGVGTYVPTYDESYSSHHTPGVRVVKSAHRKPDRPSPRPPPSVTKHELDHNSKTTIHYLQPDHPAEQFP